MGGTAGGIHLAVVVHLHDLDIAVREEGGSLRSQAAQYRNAQTHIAAVKHGDFLGGVKNQGLFRLRMAGGSNDGRSADGFGIVQHIGNSRVVGEVDHRIGVDSAQLIKRCGDTVLPVDAHPADHIIA